jgi:ABC-type transport system involved in multi-copper enzyme maturation permease subunit
LTVVLRRLAWEHRLRLPLIVAGAAIWGFALVGLFATADQASRTAGLTGNIASAFRILGLDPLAAWVALGQTHPVFLVGSFFFTVALGTRAVAGELAAGTLELTLARPLSRRAYLGVHLAFLVPGCVAITLAYGTGALVADRAFDPPGAALLPGRLVVAAIESCLLLVAIGVLALGVSVLASDGGRALAWALGIAIAMYAGNLLFSLWSPLRPFARLSLFWYFTPGNAIERGSVSWSDSIVLVTFTAVAAVAAVTWFERRDLAA